MPGMNLSAKANHVLFFIAVAVMLSSCTLFVTGSKPDSNQILPSLNEYKTRMRDVLTLPDVVFLDADEICNCIAVGILSQSGVASVENFAKNAGVPLTSIKTVLTSPFIRFASLRDNIRPTKGGFQIQNNDYGRCTLTASVFNKDRNKKGMITCSHCTKNDGGVEDTDFYQPGDGVFGLDHVAKEVIDPPFTSSLTGCPTGRICRRSDSAYAEFDTSGHGIVGKLALPKSMCFSGACSLDMDSLTDELTIIGLAGAPRIGDRLGKIGRTTGWTQGQVIRTCLDIKIHDNNLVDTNITLLCQHDVAAVSGKGDSGAPVFSLLRDNKVVLAGILWGGDSANTVFVFSAISDVEAELGMLEFY